MEEKNPIYLFKLMDFCKSRLPFVLRFEKNPYRHQIIHTHDCIEMVFVTTGAGSCAVNGIRYPMLAGDIYIIFPGSTHEFDSDVGLHFYNIMFDRFLFQNDEEMAIFEGFLKRHEDVHKRVGVEVKYTVPPTDMDTILHWLQTIEKELIRQDECFEYEVRSQFLHFLIYLRRNNDSLLGILTQNDQMALSRVFNCIMKNYHRKITLAELAKLTGNSPAYLGKHFKALIGVNLSIYICRYRVECARKLLLSSENTIAEIAYKCGFCDAAYFIKSFQKYCGTTPAQYRKSTKKSE